MSFSLRVIAFDVGTEEMSLEILVSNPSLSEAKNIKTHEIYSFLTTTVHSNDSCKAKKKFDKNIFTFQVILLM